MIKRYLRAIGIGAAAGMLAFIPAYAALDAASSKDATASRPKRVQPSSISGPAAGRTSGGCGCHDVVVKARNLVRDAEIRSGDSRVENTHLTYISAEYVASVKEQIRIEIEQNAIARSGDALAGQIIAAATAGGTCANILIDALNELEDVEVESGEARAINRVIVLLDPGVAKGSVKIVAKQHAEAFAGDAAAGQFIGALNSGRLGCGSVKVKARNVEVDVEVESGEAITRNEKTIESCKFVGCSRELYRWSAKVDTLRVCTASGCQAENLRDFARAMRPPKEPVDEPLESPKPDADEPEADVGDEPSPSQEPGTEPEA